MDWRAWHSLYDDPNTSLARRLRVVRERIGEAVACPAVDQPLRILSLCAGDGRDLLPVLADRKMGAYRAVLVEKDKTLAADAVARSQRLHLEGVTVVIADAGLASTFTPYLPVDLVLLCGIFGNVSEGDIRAIVHSTPSMLRRNGTVIWTRASTEPDLRPAIRSWFADAGLEEAGWDSEPEGFGVGVSRLRHIPPSSKPIPERLFAFIEYAIAPPSLSRAERERCRPGCLPSP